MSNHLAKHRADSCDSKDMDNFFDLVKDNMQSLNLSIKPTHIFNVDETAFACRTSTEKVFAKKGVNRVNKLTGNNDKINFTVQVIIFIYSVVQ